jgi:hypothetical protein
LSQNTAGKIGKTNGKQSFLSLPSTLSNSEKTAWKTTMNGGWTTDTMSVAAVTPSVVDKQNKNYWITLKGTNLNLPPASFSLDIMAQDGITKIATVPNSQVQLYTNGLDLTFYYNFKDLAIGEYKIRLWNGVAYYITSLTINVASALNTINLNNLVWETKLFTPGTSNIVTVSGGAMSYVANPSNKPYAYENAVVAAVKSSEFVAAGQNFIMSGTLRLRDSFNSLMNIILGVINKDNILSLNNNSNFNISINCNGVASNSKTIKGDTLFLLGNQNEADTLIVWSISRNGNIFSVMVQYAGGTTISSKTGIDEALSLVCYLNNTSNNGGVGADAGFNIQTAYKF